MNPSADKLTWAALLGHWVEFARGALALPQEGDGRLLRESVADLIALQAVTFALKHVDELDAGERALGLDRAAVLIEKHTAALAARWSAGAMPRQMELLIGDARAALNQAGRRHP